MNAMVNDMIKPDDKLDKLVLAIIFLKLLDKLDGINAVTHVLLDVASERRQPRREDDFVGPMLTTMLLPGPRLLISRRDLVSSHTRRLYHPWDGLSRGKKELLHPGLPAMPSCMSHSIH
jgi:hypothetical protein